MQAQARTLVDQHIEMAVLHKMTRHQSSASSSGAAAAGDPFHDVPITGGTLPSVFRTESARSAEAGVAESASAAAREAVAISEMAIARIAVSSQCLSPDGLTPPAPPSVKLPANVATPDRARPAQPQNLSVAAVAAPHDEFSSPEGVGNPGLLAADYAATAPAPPLAHLASPFDACW